MPFPVALSSYSFRNLIEAGHLNLFGYLELVYSRYRVSQADLSSALLPPESLVPDKVWKIHDFFLEREMKLACLCIDGPTIWSDDPAKRQADRNVLLDYLDAARRLEARTVRIDLGQHDTHAPMSEEAFEAITSQCREYSQFCGDYGMRIGPENMDGFSRIPADLRRLQKAVDHPAFGHLLHVGNWAAGSGREMVEACLPSLMHVHIPAESVIWAKDLIRKIARTSYSGVISIEQACSQHELVRAEWQLSVLRGLIAELECEGLEKLTPPGYYWHIAKIAPPDGILDF